MKKKRSFLSIPFALVLCCMLSQPVAGQGPHGPFQKGGKLTSDEVLNLEEKLSAEPDNKAIRKKILGYYFRTHLRNKDDSKRRLAHVMWFIENDPESNVFQTPYLQVQPHFELEGYRKAASKWEELLKQAPENEKIIKSAAQWFSSQEFEKSVELAERGKQLEPNDRFFPELLARNYSRRMIFTRDQEKKTELAKRSLEEFKLAHELSDPKKQSYMLGDMAKAAYAAGELNDAKAYANQMLDEESDGWNSGNNVHAANNYLGLVAIKAGDLEEAKRRLLVAGSTKGSPTLNSFGPSMLLANELLKHDQKEVVLEYFELCRKFWERGNEELDQWSEEVDKGRIPDFGSSLIR